ncbi:ABC transporter substrate-binding protein [Pseudoalteromonas aliena]|uniref:ABC transporter substrate-binding protein n=1 Tax=Pseudoalteromonas aliena TaxID=247523 RepID=UPI002494F1FB|nr:ABC transporter substrate-binding protein [Pseudoalteromonas aliena]
MLFKGLIIGLCFFCSHIVAQKSVTLQLKWTHQFQFAGYYMAKQKGFYDEVGLDVIIKPANPMMPDTFEPVANNKAQFGVGHSGILQQRINGQPLVAMAAMLQFSPYCWMVKDTSDIFHPRNFANKRITGVSRKDATELMVMLKRSGVDTDRLKVYEGENPNQAWIENTLDAMQVYVTTEPYYMTQQGIAHRLICPQRYGMDVYADILFTSEYMLKKHPQTVEKFYQASLKGWRYAMMNMDEAINVTQQVYAPSKSFHQLAFEAEVLKDYIMPPTTNLGHMSIAKWRLIADLYSIQQSKFDEVKAGFIYKYQEPEAIQLSWMLIAAILVSIISIPLYIRLIFSKK